MSDAGSSPRVELTLRRLRRRRIVEAERLGRPAALTFIVAVHALAAQLNPAVPEEFAGDYRSEARAASILLSGGYLMPTMEEQIGCRTPPRCRIPVPAFAGAQTGRRVSICSILPSFAAS
jgi:hypothetical protein